MQERTWFKTRYYPVNLDAKVIYDDPQKRDGDCWHVANPRYKGLGTFGTKGSRLNEHACYKGFTVLPAPN